MIDFITSTVSFFFSTFIPALLSLIVVSFLSRRLGSVYVYSYSLGIFLWFFVDTIEGSANLDVNAGFSGGLPQFLIVLSFLIALLVFGFLGDHTLKLSNYIVPAILLSFAMGIHGIGEGAAFGGTAALTSSSNLLDAFGGVSAVTAYILHKVLEPVVIGAYNGEKAGSMGSRSLILSSVTLAFFFSLGSLAGAVTGYFLQYDSSYFYAAGTGSSVFALYVIFSGMFKQERRSIIKLFIAVALGLVSIYVAALFHSD